jgi:hypothetical protein
MTQDIWLLRGNEGMSIAKATAAHIAAYETKFGRPPVEILAHHSVVAEIRQHTALRVTGTKTVPAHEMMLRH